MEISFVDFLPVFGHVEVVFPLVFCACFVPVEVVLAVL
jgi:hypothetical protein